MLVTDACGRAGAQVQTGYFFRETRYLRHLRFLINGEDPTLCGIAEVDFHTIELSHLYPEGASGEGEKEGVPFRNLDLRLRYRVRPSSLEALVTITSHWADVEFDLAWELSADFADLNEAEGGDRQQDAPVESIPEHNGVRFRYGHPDLPLETLVTIAGPGDWKFQEGRLAAHLQLKRSASLELRMNVSAIDCEDPLDDEKAKLREALLEEWLGNLTTVSAPGEAPFVTIVNQAMQSVGSFALLEGNENEWLTPAAAVPLYPILFGRDAGTISYHVVAFDHGRMADSSLRRLARMQGTKVDDSLDEEPGRIIYQARTGPLARLKKIPHQRYYADYASPFDFIFAMGHAYSWNGDTHFLENHWDAARGVLDWARDYADKDGDGYLEYLTLNEQGPKHQGWKDSSNAIVREDGSQVLAPIAACEVQSYLYMALRIMAALSVVMKQSADGLAHWRAATELKKRFNRDFWIEEEDCIAIGLDKDKKQIRTVASNAGCFATGILDDDRLPRLVRRLFQPDMFSGWGIRTLSDKNPAFNPLSYHLGTVWPVENATIVFGLRRYGFDAEALQLTRALYDLALLWKGSQIPECVGGYRREDYAHPGAFPRANVPQAWNQSSFPLLLQSMLGLQPLATINVLAVDPKLPEWLPDVTLRNLRLGNGSADLRFRRDDEGKSKMEVLSKSGSMHIVHQAPAGSLTAGIWDRLGALVGDAFPF